MRDFLFVKADVESPRDMSGSYRFASHFARTLVDLNNCSAKPIANHSPMTVDLPFKGPTALGRKEKPK